MINYADMTAEIVLPQIIVQSANDAGAQQYSANVSAQFLVNNGSPTVDGFSSQVSNVPLGSAPTIELPGGNGTLGLLSAQLGSANATTDFLINTVYTTIVLEDGAGNALGDPIDIVCLGCL